MSTLFCNFFIGVPQWSADFFIFPIHSRPCP
nr:MAG TPA: hypothetical protein [Caudoviricetes sp.]